MIQFSVSIHSIQASCSFIDLIIVLGKPLDEFQAAFQELRKKSRIFRETVDKRRQIVEKEGPKDK